MCIGSIPGRLGRAPCLDRQVPDQYSRAPSALSRPSCQSRVEYIFAAEREYIDWGCNQATTQITAVEAKNEGNEETSVERSQSMTAGVPGCVGRRVFIKVCWSPNSPDRPHTPSNLSFPAPAQN